MSAIYIEQKQYDKAGALLDIGLSMSPDDPVFTNLKSHILVAQNKPDQAIELLQNQSPSIADHPGYYAFLAFLYQQQGYYQLSAGLYGELANQDPENGLWWLGRAIGLEKSGQRNAALIAYQHASASRNLSVHLRAYVDEQIRKLQ